MKKVLLTGAAGFIGSHTAEAYLEKGYAVVGVDNFSSGKRENLCDVENNENFTFCEGDIRDRDFVNALYAQHKPHIINHQAAQKSVPASVDNPHHDAEENVLALLNLLMAHKTHAFEQFIFASSGGALAPIPQGNKIPTEDDKPQLLSPYAVTKFAGENYIALYAALFNFSYTALRYANVYGPRQIPEGECGVIPIFVENAMQNKPSVLFAYPDMPEGCTRDYVHVSDVAAANILSAEKPANTVIHISSAIELPIAKIYAELMLAMGKDLPLHREGPRAGDIRRSVVDNARARELLGWVPKIGLKEGLKDLVLTVSYTAPSAK
ncbi:MAG: SDR family NAD(P)-dependent oxidoreductase [Defluviitaleaceae bacterium]|nr:SDR family NAD(P)-dependent oxidoreductase [Defluviitaleaceae bacterium]MCL2273558.1 SDR family NAD(P)-dependent oxidoreductase [Defluviitaleaceae bacterium]